MLTIEIIKEYVFANIIKRKNRLLMCQFETVGCIHTDGEDCEKVLLGRDMSRGSIRSCFYYEEHK